MATREQVDELLSKMATERAALFAAVDALSAGDLLRVPQDAEGEEQWTALEQLAHLGEMERNYDAWVRRALREDNPDIWGTPVAPVAIPIEAANTHTAAALLHELKMERQYTLGLIDGIALADFERTATSPMFGTLTVMQWLRSFYRHDRQHAAQILGRKSDYQPNFTGEEPNQRQARIDLVARRNAENRA